MRSRGRRRLWGGPMQQLALARKAGMVIRDTSASAPAPLAPLVRAQPDEDRNSLDVWLATVMHMVHTQCLSAQGG